MSATLELRDGEPGTLWVAVKGGGPLWQYQFEPAAAANESPRPFAHPVYSIHGDVLTNWRPNDHPWHHGLSFTLTSVNGVNFWGGPSHRAEDGYQWRDDQGVQQHRGWTEFSAERLVESVAWCNPTEDRVLLTEERTLVTRLVEGGWSLQWTSQLTNVSGEALTAHNYHSLGGLKGSHYTGLQFRGARELLHQHGDSSIGLVGERGETDPEALQGREASTLEWRTQHDGSLRRTTVRFESLSGPIPWFVRPLDTMVAFAPHREEALVIAPGETRTFDHRLQFITS